VETNVPMIPAICLVCPSYCLEIGCHTSLSVEARTAQPGTVQSHACRPVLRGRTRVDGPGWIAKSVRPGAAGEIAGTPCSNNIPILRILQHVMTRHAARTSIFEPVRDIATHVSIFSADR